MHAASRQNNWLSMEDASRPDCDAVTRRSTFLYCSTGSAYLQASRRYLVLGAQLLKDPPELKVIADPGMGIVRALASLSRNARVLTGLQLPQNLHHVWQAIDMRFVLHVNMALSQRINIHG